MATETIKDATYLMLTSYKKRKTMAFYEDTDEDLERFKTDTERYFRELVTINAGKNEKEEVLPSFEAWAAFMGLTKRKIKQYEKERKGEWPAFIEYVKGLISSRRLTAAEHGRIPPMIHVFDMVNNYGYQNTNQVDNSEALEGKEKAALRANDLPKLKTELDTAEIAEWVKKNAKQGKQNSDN